MQRMYGSAFAVTETRKFRTYHVNFPHPNTLISSKNFPFPFSYRFQQNLHKLHFIFEFGEKKKSLEIRSISGTYYQIAEISQ